MQWDDSPYGGFSTVEPWMRVPEDHKYCNVARQIKEGDSVLAFWKEMLALRKDLDDALVCVSHRNTLLELIGQIYGTFEHLSPEDERIFAYTRAGTVMVVLNFSEEDVSYCVPHNLERAKPIKSTLPGAAKMNGSTISLRPYSGVIYVLCARGGQDLLSGA
jgi:glycosidase